MAGSVFRGVAEHGVQGPIHQQRRPPDGETTPRRGVAMGASLEALGFRQVWAVDFEFSAPPGERPAPICMVARELLGGNTIRIFGENLTATKEPPFDVGAS